ncbi:hypothetical protein M407DRAFT_5157 [Tulasnella calospora MUT 4182]|uniref:Uncharacterized protein n=1 Tax=Tulasnella calospora MUT 4182 TaxID=1051891 RepID=A0A0C3LBU4_9AGAM|nr:hypothetical protein M407DRAFT_5157 [Tulasnella calospora MUT 4182]
MPLFSEFRIVGNPGPNPFITLARHNAWQRDYEQNYVEDGIFVHIRFILRIDSAAECCNGQGVLSAAVARRQLVNDPYRMYLDRPRPLTGRNALTADHDIQAPPKALGPPGFGSTETEKNGDRCEGQDSVIDLHVANVVP